MSHPQAPYGPQPTYHTRTDIHGNLWHLKLEGCNQYTLIRHKQGKARWSYEIVVPVGSCQVYHAEYKDSSEEAFRQALAEMEGDRKKGAGMKPINTKQ